MHKTNSLIRRAMVILMFILCLVDLAMAGDNAAFGVSCSIPLVPGLNAPLDAKTELIQEDASSAKLTQASNSITTIYYR
ncbi:MAG TPA: hypothetical protein VMD04_02520 [Candidatus Margulisiibacteriota bacterium]|nr:hypothetical protein [Candidatus Margulisiibacteriota bacterium]